MHSLNCLVGFLFRSITKKSKPSGSIRNSVHHYINYTKIAKVFEGISQAVFSGPKRKTTDKELGGGIEGRRVVALGSSSRKA
nr:hypothetical protein Iba_chr03eCG12020 [Ipomoea batatas]